MQILRFSCFYIAAAYIKFGRIIVKGCIVIRIQLFRQRVVAEPFSCDVSGEDKVSNAHKARVLAVFFIISDVPPALSGKKAAAVDGSCGYSDHSVKGYSLIHKEIQHAGCIDPAHSAAFQHKSCLLFHFLIPPFGFAGRFCPAGISFEIYPVYHTFPSENLCFCRNIIDKNMTI